MDIKVYSTPGCFYCEQLKELFRRASVDYEEIEVGFKYSQEKFHHDFPNAPGYPWVVIDGEEIGGLTDVAKMFLQKGLVSAPKK